MSDLTRRAFGCAALAGLAAPALVACGADESEGPHTLPVATGDVPVGGGVVLTDDKLVVTQPTEGEFKCFSSTCTHQGCPVTAVEGGTINCNCHGSKFSITDGSVKGGPASKPLAEKQIKVDGDNITLA
jgi:Rieske Fe-S protein